MGWDNLGWDRSHPVPLGWDWDSKIIIFMGWDGTGTNICGTAGWDKMGSFRDFFSPKKE